MVDKYPECNATMYDLKNGDCFKFYPNDNINIVMDTHDEQLRYFDLEYNEVCRFPLLKNKHIIIVPREDVIKKS